MPSTRPGHTNPFAFELGLCTNFTGVHTKKTHLLRRLFAKRLTKRGEKEPNVSKIRICPPWKLKASAAPSFVSALEATFLLISLFELY